MFKVALLLFLAFMTGIWAKANVDEYHSTFKRVGSFVVFLPVSIMCGYYVMKELDWSIYLAALPGLIGFLIADPFEQ